MSDAAPGRVLRLALVAWGFGDLAMGRRASGIALLVAELIGLALIVASSILLSDTTWYLVPFLVGMAFIVAWSVQAIAAFLRAQRLQGAIAPPSTRSPAAAAAWLTVPLLLWGTGFWLFAAEAATPGAVLDAFVTEWPDVAAQPLDESVATDPVEVSLAAATALANLRQLCDIAGLTDDCREEASALLVNVRMRIDNQTYGHRQRDRRGGALRAPAVHVPGHLRGEPGWCRCRSRPSCAWTWRRSRPRWAPRAGSS